MKILFLGYAVHENLAGSLSGASIAGNKMQLNILHNMKGKTSELKVITVLPVAAYPKERKWYVRKKVRNIGQDIMSTCISFLNFPLVKQISQIISVYREAAKYIKQNRDAMVLTYNMFPQVGIPARWLKRKFGCRIVALLADLPIDDNYNRKGFSRFLRGLFDESTKRSLLEADQVIVLNKNARELFAPQADYLVIDGGVNLQEYPIQQAPSGGKERKNIVYGGSLAEYSGIGELVDAMELVKNSEIELDIYGDGTLREYILSKAGQKIHYHGKVSNVELLKKQREAWLLVNPRPIDDPIAQVTFPSKIFEYLMSGTPVLSTRLNGFSEEYEGKLFFAESNSSDELAKWIDRIAGMEETELKQVAEAAERFVREERNWPRQVEKMLNFIDHSQNG